MFKLHFDLYSTQAEAFMAVLSPLLPDTELGRMLKNWDFNYTGFQGRLPVRSFL
ncbi:MAG: hypothetical protein R2860_13945 [Desulfobacterales bacterium]